MMGYISGYPGVYTGKLPNLHIIDMWCKGVGDSCWPGPSGHAKGTPWPSCHMVISPPAGHSERWWAGAQFKAKIRPTFGVLSIFLTRQVHPPCRKWARIYNKTLGLVP